MAKRLKEASLMHNVINDKVVESIKENVSKLNQGFPDVDAKWCVVEELFRAFFFKKDVIVKNIENYDIFENKPHILRLRKLINDLKWHTLAWKEDLLLIENKCCEISIVNKALDSEGDEKSTLHFFFSLSHRTSPHPTLICSILLRSSWREDVLIEVKEDVNWMNAGKRGGFERLLGMLISTESPMLYAWRGKLQAEKEDRERREVEQDKLVDGAISDISRICSAALENASRDKVIKFQPTALVPVDRDDRDDVDMEVIDIEGMSTTEHSVWDKFKSLFK